MSRISEVSAAVSELREAASLITEVANYLAELFSTPADAPEETPVIKLEDVRSVLANASRSGHTTEVRELLLKYGADRLSGIDPGNYAALLKDAEVFQDAT